MEPRQYQYDWRELKTSITTSASNLVKIFSEVIPHKNVQLDPNAALLPLARTIVRAIATARGDGHRDTVDTVAGMDDALRALLNTAESITPLASAREHIVQLFNESRGDLSLTRAQQQFATTSVDVYLKNVRRALLGASAQDELIAVLDNMVTARTHASVVDVANSALEGSRREIEMLTKSLAEETQERALQGKELQHAAESLATEKAAHAAYRLVAARREDAARKDARDAMAEAAVSKENARKANELYENLKRTTGARKESAANEPDSEAPGNANMEESFKRFEDGLSLKLKIAPGSGIETTLYKIEGGLQIDMASIANAVRSGFATLNSDLLVVQARETARATSRECLDQSIYDVFLSRETYMLCYDGATDRNTIARRLRLLGRGAAITIFTCEAHYLKLPEVEGAVVVETTHYHREGRYAVRLQNGNPRHNS